MLFSDIYVVETKVDLFSEGCWSGRLTCDKARVKLKQEQTYQIEAYIAER